ncbi:hypothetical protein PMIN06_003906 [Paraphaeosphaeria minitans]
MQPSLLLLALASAAAASPTHSPLAPRGQTCRKLPQDKDWPSQPIWSVLNATVGGRLIATTPLASPCHDPNYDAAKCDALRAGWVYPQTHFESSTSIVAPYFQNQSCDPFTPRSSACKVGTYPSYAVKVTKASDAIAGMLFAQLNNVRLVIKNTGHDLLGRSTGTGGLSLWTHYLKDITIKDYTSSSYTGKAMKMGAGVQAYEAYDAAHKQNLRVVGGTCPTVGLAGGYTQGGGHSMLSTIHGLGADQVLEWEVVTANGSLLTATPDKNSDLYWALSGGGGGTYGLVLSMTVKAYADTKVTGAMLTLIQQGADDAFWNGITLFHAAMTSYTDAGAAFGYYLGQGIMAIQPVTFPGKSKAEVAALMLDLTKKLDAAGTVYTLTITEFSNYYEFFNNYYGPLPYGTYTSAQVQGGRLIPRQVVATASANQAFTDALKTIVSDQDFHVVGVGLDVSKTATASNAVHPKWRSTAITIVVAANWDYTQPFAANTANETLITNKYDPLLTTVTGADSGAYVNEGDFQQPSFQDNFFGSNYAKLRSIKNKYDPNSLFYATKLVGSEDWTVQADGRLCKA